MALAGGARLGAYEILGLLGRGGMGEVYEARDTRLNRTVALKLLPADVAQDPERLARLHREALTIAALNHPNIVTLHAMEESDGVPFLVMERVDGRPLAESIDRKGLPVPRLLEIAIAVANALAAAHRSGVVHRDLKPANVMLTRDGRVKVLDFGLARAAASFPAESAQGATVSAAPPLTADHHVVGTLPYMAPEQVRGEPADARTDIFAFGATLYEMATGARPFSGPSSAELMLAILSQDPPRLDAARPDLPPGLVRLVSRCMEKDPPARVQSAVDLSHDLQDLLQDVRGRPALAKRPRAGRYRRPLAAATAVTIVLAAAAILFGPRLRAPVRPSPGPVAIHSIAVLPFENLMRDPSQDYFVDGIHDALILELAKLGTFRVTSRSSVMRYRQPSSLKDVARELGVDAIIEGTVLRDGNNVRVTAQLILGGTDEHVWADRYVRNLDDVLTLLDDVSRAIAAEVQQVARGPAVATPAAATAKVRPEAYDLYLKARQRFREGGAPALQGVREDYARVVRLDPGFARGWGSLASADIMLAFFDMRPAREVVPSARAEAQRAMALDDRDGLAYANAGTIALYYDWDFEKARTLLERAVALEPHSLMSRHAYADYLMTAGRLEESIEQVRLGRTYDPDSAIASVIFVAHLRFGGRERDAIVEARRLLEASPRAAAVRGLLAEALWHQGQYDDALVEYRRLYGADHAVPAMLERELRRSGPRSALSAYARFLASQGSPSGSTLLMIAALYAQAGEVDAAMEWLEKAYGERVPQLLHVIVEPAFDGIRTDPRYAAMMERIGLRPR